MTVTDDEAFIRRIVDSPGDDLPPRRATAMTGSEFQRLLDADPFEPFTVALTGGATQTIDRPELVVVTPGDCARISLPDGSWAATISLDHVTSITPIAPVIVRRTHSNP
jgi:hypothetical protein